MRRDFDEHLRDLLVRHQLLDQDASTRAFEMSSAEEAPSYVDILLSHRMVDERKLLEAVAGEKGWPIEDLDDARPTADALALVPRDVAESLAVLPLRIASTGELVVAVPETFTPQKIDEIRFVANKDVRPALSTERRIRAAIYRAYESPDTGGGDLDQMLAELSPAVAPDGDDDEAAPVVVLIDTFLQKAVACGATHVHFDRTEREMLVRFRAGGRTVHSERRAAAMHAALVSRLKIMASMDISERRLPQDGRLSLKTDGREFEFMVATLPTQYGERVVLRVIELAPKVPTLAEMGAPPAVIDAVRAVLGGSGGLFVAQAIDNRRTPALLRSILMETDPAERVVIGITEETSAALPEGVARVIARSKIGFTFATALRAAARHDADVLMVEDLRDSESLDMALECVRRGQVVVAGCHATDPAAVPARFIDMGADRVAVASALKLVLFQAAFPRLCAHCRRRTGSAWEPVGCPLCVRGYKGEAFVYQAMKTTDATRPAAVESLGQLARPMVETGTIAERDLPR